MQTIRINTPTRRYDVKIARGALAQAGDSLLELTKPCRAVIVTDDTVRSLYGNTLLTSLSNAGFKTALYSFPAGEESKTLTTFIDIQSFLADRKLTRSDYIVTLGGGIPGDMGGFCAACFQRGIRFIQIPTTLLSAVDASVGGKTAVNLPQGKNLVGAFYQPDLVLCDPDTLRTLPAGVFADGMAEVIKYGVIRDAEFFRFLETCDVQTSIEAIIRRCVEIKAEVVSEDERESGVRAILNFGHTLAHAIEKCSNFQIPHGRAVGIGMVLESRALYRTGYAKTDYTDRLKNLLIRHGLDTATDYSAQALYDAAVGDKKRTTDGIRLLVVEEIGKCVVKQITLADLRAFIEAAVA